MNVIFFILPLILASWLSYLLFGVCARVAQLIVNERIIFTIGKMRALKTQLIEDYSLKIRCKKVSFLGFHVVLLYLEKNEFFLLENSLVPIWIFEGNHCILQSFSAQGQALQQKYVLAEVGAYKVFIDYKTIEPPASRITLSENLLKEKYVDKFLSYLPQAAIFFDPNLIIKKYNSEAEKLLGLPANCLGKNFGELLEMLRFRRMLPEVLDFLKYKRNKVEELKCIKTKNIEVMQLKENLFIEWTYIPNPEGIIIFFKDVSELFRLKQEQYLQNTLERKVFDSLDFGVIIFDQNHNIYLANQFFLHKILPLPDKLHIFDLFKIIETNLHIQDLLSKNLNTVLKLQEFQEQDLQLTVTGKPLVYGFYLLAFYPAAALLNRNSTANNFLEQESPGN